MTVGQPAGEKIAHLSDYNRRTTTSVYTRLDLPVFAGRASGAQTPAMRSDGSDVRQLTDNKWEDASPGWMPEPKK